MKATVQAPPGLAEALAFCLPLLPSLTLLPLDLSDHCSLNLMAHGQLSPTPLTFCFFLPSFLLTTSAFSPPLILQT